MTYSIEFGPKFTQAQMEDIFIKKEDYFGLSCWERSFLEENKEIIFDLTITEWISTEQIAFLFAWIKNIKAIGRKIKIKVPFRNNIESSGFYTPSQLSRLAIMYKSSTGELYKENELRIKRRKRCGAFLLVIWGMLDELGLKEQEGDFLNMADFGVFNRESRKLHENNHQIIPFSAFDLSFQRQNIKYDHYFQELINNNLDASVRTKRIFELQHEIQILLKKYACYSPFESKILSNVITQELYINSLQHASKNESSKGTLLECYMTASLSNRWQYANNPNFVPSFTEEKYPETLDFYKDKEQIKQQINALLADGKNRSGSPRDANLSRFNRHFLNRSYLEETVN